MRYVLMFSLAALFLAACGDTDNPVVTTAPAGKTTVELSEEECQAATSLPESFLEKARELNPDLDEDLLLSTWKANGCDDAVLWGLSWMVTNDAEVTFEVVIYTPPPEDEPKTAAHTKGTGDANIHTQSEINSGHGRATSYLSTDVITASTRNVTRFDNLQAAGVLPTVSVNGCGIDIDHNGIIEGARFTFSRTGPTDENLTFAFTSSVTTGGQLVSSTTTVSGFRAGNSNSQWEESLSSGTVTVRLIEGWHNDMTDDYQLGKSKSGFDDIALNTCP